VTAVVGRCYTVDQRICRWLSVVGLCVSRRCPVFIDLGVCLGYPCGLPLFVFELYDVVKSLFRLWTILRVAGLDRLLVPVAGPINLTLLLL
jgi:hypothetical protein